MINGLPRAARIEDNLIRRVERRQASPPELISYQGGGVTCFRRDDALVVRPAPTPVAPMATVMCAATPLLAAPAPLRVVSSPPPARTDLVGLVEWDFSRPSPRYSKQEKRARRAEKAKRNAKRVLHNRLAAIADEAIVKTGWSRVAIARMIESDSTAWGMERLEALIASLEKFSARLKAHTA